MGFIDDQLELIDERIQKIDNSKIMRQAQALIEEKDKLLSARRALLGAGPKLTSGGGSRTTQKEVVEWFKANVDTGETITVEQVAKGLGVTVEVARGHLNRGKDERFLTPSRGVWALRDPENGINDVDDLDG